MAVRWIDWATVRWCNGMQGEAGDAGTTKVLLVEEAQQEFVFTEVSEKPVPSVLRGFSAPVKLQVSQLLTMHVNCT